MISAKGFDALPGYNQILGNPLLTTILKRCKVNIKSEKNIF
jgi:hypothetical protein